MRKLRLSCTLVIALGLYGCAGNAEKRFVSHMRNKPAQDFELKALDGANVKLSDFRGKPVLLAFFAYG